jgi:hypothetical protein
MTRSQGPGGPTAAGRLLAEAVRHDEAAQGAPSAAEEAAALARARAVEGSVEAKVVARAEALPNAGRLAQELDRLRALLRGTLLAALALAALAGAATARTALASADGLTVNFFWLLLSLLGLHVASFLAWCVLMAAAPGATRGGVLGGAVLWLWRLGASRLGAGRHRAAALQAAGSRWGRGAAGRWLVSSLSHGLWAGYLLGALVMTLLLLGAQRYHFVWETTILSAATYIRLTAVLAALPRALGIAVPDQATVVGAEWPGPDQAMAGDEGAWSSLLIACIVLYGLVPRLLALGMSVLLARRAARTTTLDLSRPGYARLVPLLSPEAPTTRVVDPDRGGEARRRDLPDLDAMPKPPPAGPVFLLGWEIDVPGSGWPPPVAAEPLRDLGRLDGRAELDETAGVLERAAPARVVVAVDLRQTPDRGIVAALGRLKRAAGDRLVLLLSGEAGLHQRLASADASDRLADWVAAARAAGIGPETMVAIDLDRLSDPEPERLARLLGAAS